MSSVHIPTASPFRQPRAVWAVAFACVISFLGIGLVTLGPSRRGRAAQLADGSFTRTLAQFAPCTLVPLHRQDAAPDPVSDTRQVLGAPGA